MALQNLFPSCYINQSLLHIVYFLHFIIISKFIWLKIYLSDCEKTFTSRMHAY